MVSKAIAKRVAAALKGVYLCPECEKPGHMWKNGMHCTNRSCDVRFFQGGEVLTRGYLTDKREGPGT